MTPRESAKLQMYLAVAALCEQPEHAAAVARIPDFDAVLQAFLALPIPLDRAGHPADSELLDDLLLEGDLCLERMDDLSTDLMAEFPAFVRAYDVTRLIGFAAARAESANAGKTTAARPAKRGSTRTKALGRHRLPPATAAEAAAPAAGSDGLSA
ncbi:MAG: hypothetical protein KGS60_19395 [Verrucomicrobia bacterium]|nr:hypothetical protein [Verrucomicrobiota bacterium]